MTSDMWQLVGSQHSLKISAPQLWDWQCLKDSEQKDDSINEWNNKLINYKDVYRTALATPGLLITWPSHKLQSWPRWHMSDNGHMYLFKKAYLDIRSCVSANL